MDTHFDHASTGCNDTEQEFEKQSSRRAGNRNRLRIACYRKIGSRPHHALLQLVLKLSAIRSRLFFVSHARSPVPICSPDHQRTRRKDKHEDSKPHHARQTLERNALSESNLVYSLHGFTSRANDPTIRPPWQQPPQRQSPSQA